MKKKLALLLVLALTMTGLAACGDDETGTADDSNTENTGETLDPFYLNEEDVDAYVTLPDNYAALPVTIPAIEITDEEVTEQINTLISSYATTMENIEGKVNRAIVEGDTVSIDYVGTVDGEAFDGGSTTSAVNLTIGSGSYIPGFEEGLVGAMPGETVTVDADFPEDYRETTLAGVTAQFEITVHYILPTLEELTAEDIAILNADCSTAEELQAAVRQELYDYAYDSAVENTLLESLVEQAMYADELPQYLTNLYYNNILANLESQASYYGIDTETLVTLNYGQDLATFQETTCWEFATYNTQYALFCQAVANRENLTVSDEELNEQLQTYVDYYGYESIDAAYDKEAKESMRTALTNTKVLDFLIENAVVTVEEAAAADTTEETTEE